jgi:hypothetical protein
VNAVRFTPFVITAAVLSACSAIVTPDVSRLERDAGESMDASARSDGGPREDAFRPDDAMMLPDAGPSDEGTRDAARDGGPTCSAPCDDGIACTVDRCEPTASTSPDGCVHVPDDAACSDGASCTTDRCDPAASTRPDGCVFVRNDTLCADSVACTADRCEPTASTSPDGCVHVPDDAACSDGASCTTDRCDPAASTRPDGCVFVRNDALCADSVACTADRCEPTASTSPDGCVHVPDDAACGGAYCTLGSRCDPVAGCVGGTPRDCRDGNPCTVDTCSDALRMCVHTPRDDDGDGFPAAFVIRGGALTRCDGTDCNDADATVNPGVTEVCGNGIDDNCNSLTDEGCGGPVGDTCATAIPIALAMDGTARITGTIDGFRDDYQTDPVCGAGTGGRDVVYSLEFSGVRDVRIDTIGSGFDTVLAVGTVCSATGFEAACNDDYGTPSTGTASRIWVHRVGSFVGTTRIYILLDAYDSGASRGSYVLNVQVSDPIEDSCWPAPLDITGGGTVLGFLTRLAGAYRGTCMPRDSIDPEAIFRVVAPSSGVVDFRARSRDFNPFLYVGRDSCVTGTEIGCAMGSAIGGGVNEAALRQTVDGGTTTFVFVDGGRSGAAYTLYYRPL